MSRDGRRMNKRGLPPDFPSSSRVSKRIPLHDDSVCKYPGCNKPRCVKDSETNEMFDCCDVNHGRMLQEKKQRDLIASGRMIKPKGDDRICKNPLCNSKKYETEDGQMFDFCGKSCKVLFSKFQAEMENRRVPALSANISVPQYQTCVFPGCEMPQAFDVASFRYDMFCGNTHRGQAESLVLLQLLPHEQQYQETVKRFISEWSFNKAPLPTTKDVVSVFKIHNPKQEDNFFSYVRSLSQAKIEQYYHGTSIHCDVLMKKTACNRKYCGVCGIGRNGFSLKLIGSNIPRFMRFGKGFYLAPNSSKCHDYTQGIVDYRVMLLCDVAPGNKYIVKHDHTHLNAPPQGYDSVYGASGDSLNYDEIVLYRSESILPKYAIVYRRDGIRKIAM